MTYQDVFNRIGLSRNVEVILQVVATIRVSLKKMPRWAIKFVLQLLKYEDNNGNSYSYVLWFADLVQLVG
ncbi:hypothetical protein L6164_002626 [Bauhinia variegata]|uniref:Uncharacterized protein n=1 Tax=Bauhinia variegata TaxID=167791 RepID=A0ACB9PY78_BAUVA|nr:hypothetical protein L6164_002626 [Bauhinia variegata]